MVGVKKPYFMTDILFTICNTAILFAWGVVLFSPKWRFSKQLIAYPWVPLFLSFFYLYFLVVAGGLADADFTSLKGITTLFRQSTPESAAAGWLHYLAFDFWVGMWMIRHSQKNQIGHLWVLFPLMCTFMLGPVGILIYSLIFFGMKRFKTASEKK